jgi:hypothetical protein
MGHKPTDEAIDGALRLMFLDAPPASDLVPLNSDTRDDASALHGRGDVNTSAA